MVPLFAFFCAVITLLFVPHAAKAVALSPNASNLLAAASDGDIAGTWLRYLFQPDSSAGQTSDAVSLIAAALRGGLNIYNLSMLTIAGFFLIWQIASMIAETAQTGVAFGKRTNQLWFPMRFLLGLALLIPIGSGLNLGQSMIVTIAARGSSLASEAWERATDTITEKAYTSLAPLKPDVERYIATSFEMELCRSLYHQLYLAAKADPLISFAGDIAQFTKKPASLLQAESWTYSNAFFTGAPLCGEYRFAAMKPASETALSSSTLAALAAGADGSRIAAQRLSLQTHAIADKVATALLAGNAPEQVLYEARGLLAPLAKEQSDFVDANIRQMMDLLKTKEPGSASLGAQGWATAGALLFGLTQKQMTLGLLADISLPSVKTPLAGHDVLPRAEWLDVAERAMPAHSSPQLFYEKYAGFYDRLTSAMKTARAFLYQETNGAFPRALPDQQDVRDVLNPYADGQMAQDTLARVASAGAAAFRLFTKTSAQNATGAERGFSLLPLPTMSETGRRFSGFGSWFLGILGPTLSQPAAFGTSLIFACSAVLFWVAGLLLLYVIPVLPFLRGILAVASWFLSVFIAIATLPFVALGHFYPSGDGLVGPLPRKAYWLWLRLFMQPSLTLFAFIGGLIVFLLCSLLVHMVFFDWLHPTSLTESATFWVYKGALALLYATCLYCLANIAFSGITTFPAAVMEWFGAISVFPETLTLAGPGKNAGMTFQTLVSGPDSGGGTLVAAVTSTNRDSKSASRNTTSSATKNRSADVAHRTAQAAHFPHIPEEKAEKRVHASAQASAYAKAETASAGASESAALAASKTDQETAKAMAMAQHLVPEDKTEASGGAQKLLPTDKAAFAPPQEPKSPKTPPSREQSSTGLPDENNPFKQEE